MTKEKKGEQLYNEATQMLRAANNYILHLDVNCLWVQMRTTENIMHAWCHNKKKKHLRGTDFLIQECDR